MAFTVAGIRTPAVQSLGSANRSSTNTDRKSSSLSVTTRDPIPLKVFAGKSSNDAYFASTTSAASNKVFVSGEVNDDSSSSIDLASISEIAFGSQQIVLDSDDKKFGAFNRLDHTAKCFTTVYWKKRMTSDPGLSSPHLCSFQSSCGVCFDGRVNLGRTLMSSGGHIFRASNLTSFSGPQAGHETSGQPENARERASKLDDKIGDER